MAGTAASIRADITMVAASEREVSGASSSGQTIYEVIGSVPVERPGSVDLSHNLLKFSGQ